MRATSGGKRPRQQPDTPPPSESESDQQSDDSGQSDQSDQSDQESEQEDPEALAAEAARAARDQHAGRAANKRPRTRKTPASGSRGRSRGRTTTSNKKRRKVLNIASTGRVYCGDGRAQALRKQRAKAKKQLEFEYESKNARFRVEALVSLHPGDKTPLPNRPHLQIPPLFNYQLLIPMLASPEPVALVVTKAVRNFNETPYIAKEELIAHRGLYGVLCSPHAGLVDAINNPGVMSLPKGADFAYTPRRLEVDAAVHSLNDQKYRVPHHVEVLGGTSVVPVVATLMPVQVVVSAAF